MPSGKTAKFIWAQLRGVSDFYEGQVGAERQQAAADLARAEIQAEASAADKPEAGTVLPHFRSALMHKSKCGRV